MKKRWLLILLMLSGVIVSGVAPKRGSLRAKIRDLDNRPIPTKLVSTVSEPIAPMPDKITYHCPICEKDTVHVRPSTAYRHSMWPISLLDYMRKGLAEISKKSELPMRLDERAFCQFCADKEKKDSVFIEIEVEGKTVRNEYQNNDLRILKAFFNNHNDVDIQRGSGFRAYPLKNYIPRIKTLLGL